MATEWSDEDEIILFKSIMKCRPVGIHQNFRMINLYVSLNPDLSNPPHISMSSLHAKLKSLYDMDYLQEQVSRIPSSSDDEEDDPEKIGISTSDFSLPYNEYYDLIEAQGAKGAESTVGTPSTGKDLQSSPTQSVKTESIQPEDQDEDADEVEEEEENEEQEAEEEPEAEEEEEQEEEEEEVPQEPPPEKIPKKRGRKRKVDIERELQLQQEQEQQQVKTSKPRKRKGGSVQDSVTGTPAATDDESALGTGERTSARTANKKTRSAPSRKSTRKK